MSAPGPCMAQDIVLTRFDQQHYEAEAISIQEALRKKTETKFESQPYQQQNDLMTLLTVNRILTLFRRFSEIFCFFLQRRKEYRISELMTAVETEGNVYGIKRP